MAFGVLFRSNLAFTITAVNQIGRASIKAAANVVREKAVQNARRGMTSGQFVTPHLANNIFVHIESNDLAFVGTPVEHGKFWEEGHTNLFIDPSGGTFVRVPWLTHAVKSTLSRQQKAAGKASDQAANKFAKLAAGRLLGLTPIGPLQSTIG